jgi:RNA polymerase sigma factor (sigma-70 family)
MDMGRNRDGWSDQELLAASRSNGSGFDAFYRRHRAAVLAYHVGRAREPELAADLTAETFAAALMAVHDHSRELPQEPLAWLFTIAQRKFLDSCRRGRVEDEARQRLGFERLELDDEDIERINEIAHTTDLLSHLAARLPAEQLAALKARIVDEREYTEIAGELRCSAVVVRMRVSRALKTLRNAATEEHHG